MSRIGQVVPLLLAAVIGSVVSIFGTTLIAPSSVPPTITASLPASQAGQVAMITPTLINTNSQMAVDTPSEVREFWLNVKEAKWEIQPGTVIDGWTYNGQVPGPEIRVREGDRVKVYVTNHLPAPTTIHWHGVELDNAMDGVPGLTQFSIPPGAEFIYDFIAKPAGTRMYHSHQDSENQLELGLYGSLIIEPREAPPVPYDREYTYILDELSLDFTPAVAMGKVPFPVDVRGGLLPYDMFLMNGKAGSAVPPMRFEKGERILIRVINLGNLLHSMHLHGHTMRIVATDGNPVPREGQWLKDTVTLGPGERVDVEVVADNSGVWMFHCHMPNHSANGMMALVPYEGVTPVVSGATHGGEHNARSVQATPKPQPTLAHQSADHGTPTAEAVQAARVQATPTAEVTRSEQVPASTAVPAPNAPSATATVVPRSSAGENRLVLPMADNFFDPIEARVTSGTTVVWVNNGRNAHTISSVDGTWESPALRGRETFEFTFEKPGTYPYVCIEHRFNGMAGTIIVE